MRRELATQALPNSYHADARPIGSPPPGKGLPRGQRNPGRVPIAQATNSVAGTERYRCPIGCNASARAKAIQLYLPMNPMQPVKRGDLARIAVQAMLERGLEPRFSAEAQQQLASITAPAAEDRKSVV